MSHKRKSEHPKAKDNKKVKLSKAIESENDDDDDNKTGESERKGLFTGHKFYILQPGIEKARMNIFKTQILQNEGLLEKSISLLDNDSFIVVDDKMDVDRMLRLLDLDTFPTAKVVITVWLSICLRKKELLDSKEYEIKRPETNDDHLLSQTNEELSKVFESKQTEINISCKTTTTSPSSSTINIVNNIDNPFKDDDSDYEASDDDHDAELIATQLEVNLGTIKRKNIPVEKWICAQSSKTPQENHNKHITEKLQEMVKAYESTNDKWRSYGYQKCIRALMKHPKPISSWEEAKALPGVGSRLADKIWEIAESGNLRKLNEFKSSEEIKTMELFNNVWGAGPTTSRAWYLQGFRTIEDLRTKAKLTSQQKVGVRLYDDLIERMPREEAGRIADVVKKAAESLQPGIIAQACGSYRRGKVTCGDVDVLITHPDGKSHKGVFGKLLERLHSTGFLTDDLVSSEENGNQKKYLGVCKLLEENSKHRRLDIIVVPYHEYACAVMYFTGSAHFNRSLRLLCKRQDMSLSEHALRCGVIRQGGERVHEGTIIPTPTEESVFKVLKIPYRPPEERDH